MVRCVGDVCMNARIDLLSRHSRGKNEASTTGRPEGCSIGSFVSIRQSTRTTAPSFQEAATTT
ncbi:hypothetical protein JG687_00012133 [Phytophthora cactorum]|uniref:Uncharacterized protein n=1 Tax=Phytophthora cactorum TaxID=29920 RepID=A0A8T1U3Y0_9STRA|nr:hypothetical protein JG687_00012133 [Phytophthora cactorum]